MLGVFGGGINYKFEFFFFIGLVVEGEFGGEENVFVVFGVEGKLFVEEFFVVFVYVGCVLVCIVDGLSMVEEGKVR